MGLKPTFGGFNEVFLEFQNLRNASGGEINADFDDGDGLFFDQKKVRKKAPILQNTAVGEVSFHQRESPKASNFHLLKKWVLSYKVGPLHQLWMEWHW